MMTPPVQTGQQVVEALARSRVISRVAYRIRVDLTDFAEAGAYHTVTEVEFCCSAAGSMTWLDLVSDEVIRVQLNERDLDVAAVCGPERVLLPDLDAHNVVTVSSRHTAGAGAAGLCRSVDASDGAVYAWTQFQPFDARRMFAGFDQPDLKAVFELTVRTPVGWECVSNSPGIKAADADGLIWEFAPTPLLSTYLVALCAGPFAVIHAEAPPASGVPMALYARASLATELADSAAELFALTNHGLTMFSAGFGVGYYGQKYDHVFLPDQPGAMENLGCITWNDAAIFRAIPSAAQRLRRALVLLHELSHQWFGNLVSPRWWEDLWLSESFADWAAIWAVRTYPDLGRHTGSGAADLKVVALQADQGPSTHPVSRLVPDMEAVAASFDAITYAKGACLLQQLIDQVGEELFLAGLRGYFQRFALGNATVQGLLDELAAAGAGDIRVWASEWLRTAGVNTIAAAVTVVEGEYRSAVLTQSAPVGWPILRSHRVVVGSYSLKKGGLKSLGEKVVSIGGRSTELVELIGKRAADLLLVNDGDRAFIKARLDPDSLSVALAHGHTLKSRGSRLALRQILADMVFCVELPGQTATTTLARLIGTEHDDGAVAAMLEQALLAATRFIGASNRDSACALLADTCLQLADQAQPLSSRWYTAWQGLARCAVTTDQLTSISTLLAGDGVPQALRWQLLTRLMVTSRADRADLDREQLSDPDPDARISALIAGAGVGTAEAKWAGLDALLSAEAVPAGRISLLGASLWQATQQELLEPVAQAYLERLPAMAEKLEVARSARIIRWAFPTSGLTPGLVQRAQEISIEPGMAEIIALSLADQSDISRRILESAAL